jgi:iron complex transport system substrate-binding protein
MIRIFLLVFILIGTSSCQRNPENLIANDFRIITAGGTISEIVFELGFGDNIIATDITSTFPPSLQSLPSIGYRNQIKAEGILALGPDVLLAEEGYLNPDVISQLKASGLEIRFFAKPKVIEGYLYNYRPNSGLPGCSGKRKFLEQESCGGSKKPK